MTSNGVHSNPALLILESTFGTKVLGLSVFFLVFNTLTFSLRCLARYKSTPSTLASDDYLAYAGYITNTAFCLYTTVYISQTGSGLEIAQLAAEDPEYIKHAFKNFFALWELYLAAVALPRLSILALYTRIFGPTVRILSFVIMGIIIANWIAYFVAFFFQCAPFSAAWDKTLPEAKCFNISVYLEISNVPNVVTDIAILLVPMPTIWNLVSSKSKKMAVSFMFVVGSIGLVASITRMIQMFIFFNDPSTPNGSWLLVGFVGWSVIESGMYFTAACLIITRPVIREVLPESLKRLTSNLSDSTGATGYWQNKWQTAVGMFSSLSRSLTSTVDSETGRVYKDKSSTVSGMVDLESALGGRKLDESVVIQTDVWVIDSRNAQTSNNTSACHSKDFGRKSIF